MSFTFASPFKPFSTPSNNRPTSETLSVFIMTSAFLPPSLDSRVQIQPFCPRRAIVMLSRVQIRPFCPRGLNHDVS